MTSIRFRQSLPTQPWPLGLGFTSGWVEPTCKYHARALCVFVFISASLLILICSQLISVSARYAGPAEEDARVVQKTRLRFTWHLVADDFAESSDVQLLCRHAIRRGVHLPTAWKNKWTLIGEMPAADDMAHAAVQRARDDFALSDDTKLDCRHPVTY